MQPPIDDPNQGYPIDSESLVLVEEPEIPGPTPIERLATLIAPTDAATRMWTWLAPLLVTFFAAVLRLTNLAHPHDLMNHFDETYYIKDAWSLWNLGYEGGWPENANELFLSGQTNVFTTDGAFVVHPPLGKWLIALGMAGMGSETGWGWRLATALAGTAAVLILFLSAKRMTGSTGWGTVAGLLLAIDGLGIVMSRVALLDNILALFVLLAVWFILHDRDRTMGIFAHAVLERTHGSSASSSVSSAKWGPVLWNRPWIIAAGAALGAACAVKWSGAYILAAFGIYLVVTDALARRRAGITLWPSDAAFRQGPVTFLLFVPVALVVYLASWTGWLLTAGGYDRQSDPNPFIALWNYHVGIYNFHVGLTTEHSYASPAWQWPLMLRPTSMYWKNTGFEVDGCELPSGCVQAVTSIANPAIWYASMVAVLVLIAVFAIKPLRGQFRDWRIALVLTAIGATYVPWLLYHERTIFQFYTVVIVPFTILALVLALKMLAGTKTDSRRRRTLGQIAVAVYLVIAVGFSVFWYPLWTGMEVSYDFWRLHASFDSWI